MQFGRHLKVLRKLSKLNIDDFALLLDVNSQTIVDWETGKEIPNLDMIGKISNLLNTYGITSSLLNKTKTESVFDFSSTEVSYITMHHGIVQLYGSAIKEHIIAYTGKNHETNEVTQLSLKSIASRRVNPEYEYSNIKQQAGFSAEVKTQARKSAESIINNKKIYFKRTDDIKTQKLKGDSTIGGINDPLFDIAAVNSRGVFIKGSETQLKYLGEDSQECFRLLMLNKFDKYRSSDVLIEIPLDFYPDVKRRLREKIIQTEHIIEYARKNGKNDIVLKEQAKLDKYKLTDKNLVEGKLTNQEAIEARLHPLRSTVKDIASLSHEAGKIAAVNSVIVGGGVSFIRNSILVFKGDKNAIDALKDISQETLKSSSLGYATAFAGSSIKGTMQNSSSDYVRALSKTGLPVIAVSVLIETSQSISRLFNGEIDGTEFLHEIGQKGSSMLASAAGAGVGQIVIPIPVLGGLVGGMIGYSMSSAYYSSLLMVLSEAKLAREYRELVEIECKNAIISIRNYRSEVNHLIDSYISDYRETFENALNEINTAYRFSDINKAILASNIITNKMGKEALFEDMDDFQRIMESNTNIKL